MAASCKSDEQIRGEGLAAAPKNAKFGVEDEDPHDLPRF
jgi:hypothetical protein